MWTIPMSSTEKDVEVNIRGIVDVSLRYNYQLRRRWKYISRW